MKPGMLAVGALALWTAACGARPVVALCNGDLPVSVMLQISDSISGAPVITGIKTVFHNGTYNATVVDSDAGAVRCCSIDLPGTFDVSVLAAGYRLWDRADIVVPSDGCHAITTTVQARLVRS